jgi:hypothetical protein
MSELMKMGLRARILFCVLILECASCLAAPQSRVDFAKDIRPILADYCFACHGPDEKARKAKLRLDQRESAFKLRESGVAVIPGDSSHSEVYRRITSSDPDDLMPPPKTNHKLSKSQIELLRRWIDEGAIWSEHWAFVRPQRTSLPAVRNTRWPKNVIDHFVLNRLETEGLLPSPDASKEILIRRVSLDLTGLPPTLAEVDAFIGDRSPQAYEKVVDRLLASPRYGERMLLEWLEAARYADSNGYQADGTRVMWMWRDWALKALNNNMPFDRFTIEQLAGDLLPDCTTEQKIASGFNRNHMLNGEGGAIAEESRVGYVVDRVDTTATVWLGLTIGCARCHDHKYDPISQKEYYQLYSFFNNVDETGSVDGQNNTARPTIEFPTPQQRERRIELEQETTGWEKKLKAITDRLRPKLDEWEITASQQTNSLPTNIISILRIAKASRSEKQRKDLEEYHFSTSPDYPPVKKQTDDAKKALSEVRKAILTTMVMAEQNQPHETFVLVRGAYDKHGEKVAPNVPIILPALPASAPRNRLGLARWVADPSNPLTARVIVNRYWQHFFGTGLVKTPEDFGIQGEKPSHPELLDWLAADFVETGWNVKALHKLIVMSATYRQSSRISPHLLDRDPDNRLLARAPRFRLDSHAIRDQALALSGLLVEKSGGPPVKPYQPVGVWEDFSYGKISYDPDAGDKLYRRSIYTFWRRSAGPPTLFDAAPRQVCSVRRPRTNTPLHALTLLNDVTFVEASRALGGNVLTSGADEKKQLRLLFRSATCRFPSAQEAKVLEQSYSRFLRYFQQNSASALGLASVGQFTNRAACLSELAAGTAIASLILNLDEVMTRE